MSFFINKQPAMTWDDISRELNRSRSLKQPPLPASESEFLGSVGKGMAFITFDIGIDGVSIEIAKYARVLEEIYRAYADPKLHFVTGALSPQADTLLKSHWSRHVIDGINGWSKWEEGKWFNKLFLEEMPADSQRSSEVATEIYHQANQIAEKLGEYLVSNEIQLLIPVNVASNPGNLALALALALISETLGIVVININHDFYWDGGKPRSKRKSGEDPGERDHFFYNSHNQPFFSLFQMLYPWQGRRWLQVNINNRQSDRIVNEFGIPQRKVFMIGTCVGNKLFEDFTLEEVSHARLRMAHVFSGGEQLITARSLNQHRLLLDQWMASQYPQVIGAAEGLTLNLQADDIIYFLQPTRVIARKRIDKDVELVEALLRGPMRDTFEKEDQRQLFLHITGPTPLEHQEDLEAILNAFGKLINNLPLSIASRVFLGFSGGHDSHDSFDEQSFSDMNIIDIYRLASVVLFPSEIEGRGLPIIESAAVGLPIICSRYHPEEVFADVIGEDLPEEMRIHYMLFPEDDFPDQFLRDVTNVLERPELWAKWRDHNRQAVRSRFSVSALSASFSQLLISSYQLAR